MVHRHTSRLSLWLIVVATALGCGHAAARPDAVGEVSETQPARTSKTDSSATTAPVSAATKTVPASTRPGEDWPQFLGPRDTGVSGETGLLKTWPAEGPPQLWHRQFGEGYAAPSVRGERLVVQHRRRQREFVECLNAETGETFWQYSYDTDFADPYGYNGGTRCSPVLSATHSYTFGPQGKLLCLTLDTGEKVWERDTNQEFQVPQHFFGAGCTPILDGDRLIVLVGGKPNAGVVAFHALTGKTLWQSCGYDTFADVVPEFGSAKRYPYAGEDALVSYSTPVIATIHGKRHLLCLLRQGLVSLNPEDGALNFKYWFRSVKRESVNAARPVVIDDQIFLSAAYETGAALLKVQPDGKGYEVAWRKPQGLSTHWSTTIHHDGHLYGFSGRHEEEARLQCVELTTGTLKWENIGYGGSLEDLEVDPNTGGVRSRTSGKPVTFYGRGSAILADGKFIVLGERGTLALVEPSSEKFVELARTSFPQIRYPSWAAPVLSRGRLYLRSEDHVVCLDVQVKGE
jgi:outer membrane protein assembly factor BamB